MCATNIKIYLKKKECSKSTNNTHVSVVIKNKLFFRTLQVSYLRTKIQIRDVIEEPSKIRVWTGTQIRLRLLWLRLQVERQPQKAYATLPYEANEMSAFSLTLYTKKKNPFLWFVQ